MALRTRLSISDILHRGLVWSLVGVSVWGIVMIGVVHQNTMRAGREVGGLDVGPTILEVYSCLYQALAQQEALAKVETVKEDEKNEIALAEAAQAALKGRTSHS
ncbi:hypothetical protein C8Q78DRAFT_1082622 [Trametes maxima]|nr:hypothetical protein C8Q78DRAFT_1082622 [Trametes maxima]